MAKTILTTWDVWTYDVWGNAKEGYEVNDRYTYGLDLPIRVKVQTHNVGTEHEFTSASPSDYQLRQVFGVGCAIDTDGDDQTIYVNRVSDSYPLGELHCTSHASLSPVRVSDNSEVKAKE
jgi:hypothetical protein